MIQHTKRHPSNGQVSRKISCKPFLIYRSNEPAGLRKPCRDELRREPFRERCRKGIAENTVFMRVFSAFEYPL